MAKLYEIYYFGNAFDRARPLPAPRSDIAYARNVNGAGEYLIPLRERWIEVSRDKALARAGHAEYARNVGTVAWGRGTEDR